MSSAGCLGNVQSSFVRVPVKCSWNNRDGGKDLDTMLNLGLDLFSEPEVSNSSV